MSESAVAGIVFIVIGLLMYAFGGPLWRTQAAFFRGLLRTEDSQLIVVRVADFIVGTVSIAIGIWQMIAFPT